MARFATNGPTWSPEALRTFFTPGFESRRTAGTPHRAGFGLAVAQQLARAMGGDVIGSTEGGRNLLTLTLFTSRR